MDAKGCGLSAGKAGRLDWLDVAKGIGIILVVIAHVWTRGPVRDAIYAFHMPLFFMLGGYVSHPRPMAEFLRRQWWSMAVPYIAFLLTIALADQIIEAARGHLPMFRSWSSALWALGVGGSELRGPFTIFWFVPCLMAARIVLNALLLFWPDPRHWPWYLAMALAVFVGLWLGTQTDFSPLGLLAAPVALVFLWLGLLWRKFEEEQPKGERWLLTGAALTSLAILVFTPHVPPIDMKTGSYDMGVFSLGLAALLSSGLCAVARLLAWWRGLRFIGQQSLVIMYCHVAVVHYLTPYFPKGMLLMLALLIPLMLGWAFAQMEWSCRLFLGMTRRKARIPLHQGDTMQKGVVG